MDFDLQNQTINGTVTGMGAAVSEWWAFRSACTREGCAAAGSQLAESNQQEGTGTTSVLHFGSATGGHWQGTPTLQAPMECERTNKTGRDDETRLWSWDPQADGTLRGLMIGTILSNGCGTQGTVYRTPFVARRTGDVAPSVVVADPALFTTPAPDARQPALKRRSASYRLARSSGTSTLCSRSASSGTTSRVRSWVHASTTGAAQPS